MTFPFCKPLTWFDRKKSSFDCKMDEICRNLLSKISQQIFQTRDVVGVKISPNFSSEGGNKIMYSFISTGNEVYARMKDNPQEKLRIIIFILLA